MSTYPKMCKIKAKSCVLVYVYIHILKKNAKFTNYVQIISEDAAAVKAVNEGLVQAYQSDTRLNLGPFHYKGLYQLMPKG